MGIARDQVESAFKEMGLPFQEASGAFVTTTPGRFAPRINSVVTLDPDAASLTIMAVLEIPIPTEKRAAVYELLNHVHGQSLWNVRFHCDEDGRLFSIGKVMTWGKPFSPVQFGDIYFSLVVSADRLFPCVLEILDRNADGTQAFEKFFTKRA